MHLMLRRMDPGLFDEIAEEEGRLRNELFRGEDDDESDAYGDGDRDERPGYNEDDDGEDAPPADLDEYGGPADSDDGEDGRADDPEFLSLGEYFDGLHFLLCEQTYDEDVETPLESALAGGEESDIEGPQGMVRLLAAEDVREISSALLELDDETVQSRAVPEALEACGSLPEAGWTPATCQRLLGLFEDLREFYEEAASSGHCVLAWFE